MRGLKPNRRVLLLCGLLASSSAAPAVAQDLDDAAFDDEAGDTELIDTLQLAAVEAMMAGDWDAAEEQARAAIEIDGGHRTSQSRLVYVRALEQRGAIQEALDQLKVLLSLDLLPVHRQKAEEIQQRLQARAPEPAPVRKAAAPPPRGAGVGLMAAGAAPLVVGGLFVSWDIGFAARGVESGTWALIGAPLLATGVVMEIIGVAILAPRRASVAARPRIAPVVGAAPSPARDGWEARAGVVIRW